MLGERIPAKFPANVLTALRAPSETWQQPRPEQDRDFCFSTIAKAGPARMARGIPPPAVPRHAGVLGLESQPACFLPASLLPSRPPGLSCLHPMLQRVLIELQCLTSQRNPLLGNKSCSGAGGGWHIPPTAAEGSGAPRAAPGTGSGLMGLLNFNLNYRSSYTASVYLSI